MHSFGQPHKHLTGPRVVAAKTPRQLAREWDRIAHVRHRQIAEGRDLTFRHVLRPTIFELIKQTDATRVLDAGCGTGFLSHLLADVSTEVVGIDSSRRCIEIAQAEYGRTKNVSFQKRSLERFSREGHKPFTLAIANMVLMTVPNLREFVTAIQRVLAPRGSFVWTMTHPWFWPRYWKYEDEEWFSYEHEIVVEAPFKISNEAPGPITTHIHRPLEAYFLAFQEAHLVMDVLREPMPPVDAQRLYSTNWDYPRYLAGRSTSMIG